jgi:hypothetical protein
MRGGGEVEKALAKGQEAHVFNPGTNLEDLTNKVLTEGTPSGRVRGWERFIYVSDTLIGVRIQRGRPDIPLYVVELKGRLLPNGDWVYHLDPRTRLATS